MNRPLKAALLFLSFSVCGVAFFVAHKLHERLPPPAPRDLFAVVQEQLAAVRADDFQSAYAHAASGVQQRLTPAQFAKMMRRKCAGMSEAHRVEFGQVQVDGDSAQVSVFLFSSENEVRAYIYSLTREEETWRIDGVEEIAPRWRSARASGLRA